MRTTRILMNSNGVLSFFAIVATMTKPLMRKSISMAEKDGKKYGMPSRSITPGMT